MKKYIAIGSIILLFSLLNISAFLVGLANAPAGRVFTGAVHYPPDYYYYLSFIAQGATRWFSGYQLFNAETAMPQLVGWFYTLSGHLLLPIFRSQIIIYQVLTVAGSIFYLTASYILIKKLLPQHRSLQTLVLILFLTSSTMPYISHVNNHWTYAYITSWYNFGDPFERLTNIPHHLVFEAAAMTIFILSFGWWRGRRAYLRAIALGILGFVLASMQPVLWLVVTVVLGIIGLRSSLVPAIVVFTSGLPFVLYLKFYLYTMPPYNALTIWEPAAQVMTSLWDYVKLNGLLVLTAVLGLPLWIRALTREKFTLTCIAVLSLVLFFSPIPARVSVLNIRFLSVFPTLFYASVTGYAIWKLFVRFPKLRILLTVTSALLIALAIPLDLQPLLARNGLFTPDNSWDYLTLDAYHAYETAGKISRPNDMFLVMYPFDASFVGLTGRRIFTSYSNPLWRVNYEEKQKLIDEFYNEDVTDEKKGIFLKQSHIAFILAYSWIPLPYSGLQSVYRNNLMTIYKVLQ